jgi:hypothetical protein
MFQKSLSLLLLALLMIASLASAAGQKTTAVNVTSTIHDYDSAANLLLLRSDDFNGYQQATYTTMTTHNSTTQSSVITNGEWQLGVASTRTVYVTPNVAIDNTQPQAPPAAYYPGADVRSHCFDQNGNLVPLANVVTSSGNCHLGVNFNSGGTLYKLLISPFPFTVGNSAPPSCPSTGCPPTGVVTVTCNAVSNGQCVNWTITPNTTAPHANVANLYRYQSGRGSATWMFIGQYYNSFRIDVTNP